MRICSVTTNIIEGMVNIKMDLVEKYLKTYDNEIEKMLDKLGGVKPKGKNNKDKEWLKNQKWMKNYLKKLKEEKGKKEDLTAQAKKKGIKAPTQHKHKGKNKGMLYQ